MWSSLPLTKKADQNVFKNFLIKTISAKKEEVKLRDKEIR
jgi:hypothetical protein